LLHKPEPSLADRLTAWLREARQNVRENLLRIRIAHGFWSSRTGLTILGVVFFLFLTGVSVYGYYYIKFGRLINERLTGQVFQNTSRVFGAPGIIFAGETIRPSDVSSYLSRAGYVEKELPGELGEYHVRGSSIEVQPSKYSYFVGGNALRVDFAASKISRITRMPGGEAMESAELEPELLTNLFDSSREKRRVVRFDDLPKVMVNSVIAAEDKRFFEHGGLDIIRVLGAGLADLRRGVRAQGASTIDMQVARSFFFTTKREWSRKLKETIVAIELNERFSKQQIFELYANEIYLGNRGSFSIRGFGEGAEAYFGKDVRDLTLGEAAFLAGIIRAPNRYSTSERHPDRAIEARDRVLTQLQEDGLASAADVDAARKQKLKFSGGGMTGSDAPYFVDMVKDHLLEQYSENDISTQTYRIYSTLDPALQRAASEAVAVGMANVDKQLAKRYEKWRKKGEAVPQAQVALVALDPHTGEIRALVGGRNYGESQLNHAVARRQPGSVFKPFVYAAAFDNAVEGYQPVVTPATTVVDEPTTFQFDGNDYTPNNYGEEFYGTVTLRDALIHSLNVATVKVAEMIGYQRVVEMARQMGLDPHIRATPAVALGAYEMTPIDVAAGYTAFATNGVRAEPLFMRTVIDSEGKVLEHSQPSTRAVLDPRVAYLVTSLMEDVVDHGTGETVRAMGFTGAAAGKTGTSRDGWFAGFTPDLLCVVWIGFDDNRDLGLSGTNTAAPVWTEFMKRAVKIPRYADTREFKEPDGDVAVSVDPQSGQLATPSCPSPRDEVFVAGTEPTEFCELHGGGKSAGGSWISHIFGKSDTTPEPDATHPPPARTTVVSKGPPGANPEQPGESEDETQGGKKKGLFQKIFGIFGSSKKPTDDNTKPQP
jgi:penicillin-binding protein 1B